MLKEIRNRADWSDKSTSEKGFTLIELLVVIAILGILAVVGVLSFGGLTDGAHKATSATEKSEVQTAVDAYRAKNNGTIPADVATLQTAANNELNAGTLLCTYTIDSTSGAVAFVTPAPTPDTNKCE